jgi:RNA polymerase sigma-70 factor (ECF subfamily)
LNPEQEAIYSELLVLRHRRGDPKAFEDLIRHWEKRLFYYIRRLVDQEPDAWDILQETWLCALRRIKEVREPRALAAWLYRIARNHSMDHLRREYSDRALFQEPPCDLEEMAAEPADEFEDAERVHHALRLISLAHREVLTLHFLQDLSLEEIAEVIEVPEGTVKSRLHHAKKALRRVLEREDGRYE